MKNKEFTQVYFPKEINPLNGSVCVMFMGCREWDTFMCVLKDLWQNCINTYCGSWPLELQSLFLEWSFCWLSSRNTEYISKYLLLLMAGICVSLPLCVCACMFWCIRVCVCVSACGYVCMCSGMLEVKEIVGSAKVTESCKLPENVSSARAVWILHHWVVSLPPEHFFVSYGHTPRLMKDSPENGERMACDKIN